MTSPNQHPVRLTRDLRNLLIDLQLSDDPHAELISAVYARLMELETLVGSFAHPSVTVIPGVN